MYAIINYLRQKTMMPIVDRRSLPIERQRSKSEDTMNKVKVRLYEYEVKK